MLVRTRVPAVVTSVTGRNVNAKRLKVPVSRKNMVRVPAGQFLMGSDVHYPEEHPAHQQAAGPFWIDQHPVTNAEFHRFVAGTGWVTTAERAPDPADFPGAGAAVLVPGSLVFQPTSGPVPLDDWRRWWHWVPGADWRHPAGPGSGLAGLERHPAVHVSHEDALAYADWADKQLPTEIEWEYAARAGRAPTTYAWGEEFTRRGRRMANTWDGEFPWHRDGRHERTSPVGSYPGNAWGLADMIGNVWEWTCSPWTPDHAALAAAATTGPTAPSAGWSAASAEACCGGAPADLLQPASSGQPIGEQDRRTIKGGSHLCAPSYCRRYRPPARQGQTVRSSTSHIGFRCVIREPG
jgi:formylglycine-generating enzyme required for sulfatase activity